MNPRTMRLLEALNHDHYYLSLTDQVDEDILLILKNGWAKTWPTQALGFNAIGITSEGRKALSREEEINEFDKLQAEQWSYTHER